MNANINNISEQRAGKVAYGEDHSACLEEWVRCGWGEGKRRHFRTGGVAQCRDVRHVGPGAEEGTCKVCLGKGTWWGAWFLWVKQGEKHFMLVGESGGHFGMENEMFGFRSQDQVLQACAGWRGNGGKIGGLLLGILLFLYSHESWTTLV